MVKIRNAPMPRKEAHLGDASAGNRLPSKPRGPLPLLNRAGNSLSITTALLGERSVDLYIKAISPCPDLQGQELRVRGKHSSRRCERYAILAHPELPPELPSAVRAQIVARRMVS